MILRIIEVIIAMVALAISLIVCGAQSKTIKYLKATVEEQHRIMEKQKVLIEILAIKEECK